MKTLRLLPVKSVNDPNAGVHICTVNPTNDMYQPIGFISSGYEYYPFPHFGGALIVFDAALPDSVKASMDVVNEMNMNAFTNEFMTGGFEFRINNNAGVDAVKYLVAIVDQDRPLVTQSSQNRNTQGVKQTG